MHPRQAGLLSALILTVLLLLAGGTAMPVQSGSMQSAATPTVDVAAQVAAFMENQALLIDPTARRAAGPISGLIFDTMTSPRTPARTLLTDFIAGVTFLKTPDVSAGSWMYALYFRLANDRGYAATISSTEEWGFWRVQGSQFTQLQGGQIAEFFDVANTIFIHAVGTQGRLYINGKQVAALDLSEFQSLGDIAIGIVPQRSSETDLALATLIVWQGAGKLAEVSGSGGSDTQGGNEASGIGGGTNSGDKGSQTVFGPHSGELELSAGSFKPEGISVSDFSLKVRLYNPFAASRAPFSFGIGVREQSNGDSYFLVVTSTKVWAWILAPGKGELQTLLRGQVPGLKVTSRGYNDIELRAEGDAGTLHINGELIAELPMGTVTDAGTIFLLASTTEKTPPATIVRFEDLTITSLETSENGGERLQVGPYCTVEVRTESNFRAEPTTTSELFARLAAGTVLRVYGQNDNGQWLRVAHKGRRGWVRTSTVDGAESCGTIPIVE